MVFAENESEARSYTEAIDAPRQGFRKMKLIYGWPDEYRRREYQHALLTWDDDNLA